MKTEKPCCDKWFCRVNSLWRWDQESSVRKLEIQEGQSHGINVGAIGFDRRAPLRAAHAAKHFPEFSGCPVIRQWRFAQAGRASSPRLTGSNAVNLTRPLIGTEEKQFVLLDRSSQREPKLVLLEDRAPLACSVQKEIIRVEKLVAEELENRPMEERCCPFL